MRAIDLLQSILDYAATWAGNCLSETDFCNSLPLGTWLLQKPAKVVEGIHGLFTLQQDQRRELADAFRADVLFDQHIDEATFRFRFPALAPASKRAGGALLIAAYEEILGGAGFSGLSGQVLPCLDLKSVEEGYKSANPTTKSVCPACLIEPLPGRAKGRSMVDREHFFPKSLYPPLSVHPRNITLTCLGCNQRVHRDEDPLPQGGPGNLLGVFLPYSRPGIDEIECQFNIGSAGPAVSLRGISRIPQAGSRVRNFDRLYAIAERWNDRLSTLHEELLTEAQTRNVRTPDEARALLSDKMNDAAKLRRRFAGRELQFRYVGWLKNFGIESFVRQIALNGK